MSFSKVYELSPEDNLIVDELGQYLQGPNQESLQPPSGTYDLLGKSLT